jgi:hypothetical protein
MLHYNKNADKFAAGIHQINLFHSLMCNTNILSNLLKAIHTKVLHYVFYQCGHHQVLKITNEETAIFCIIA